MGKILFIRGHGLVNPDIELTLLYLDQLEKTLNKIVEPHTIQVLKLVNNSNEKEYLPYLKDLNLDQYDLIIGYSSGANALMRLAEERKIKRCLIIAGTFTHLLEPLEKKTGWFDKPWIWAKIKENVGIWYQIASTNDPYINLRESRILHKNLRSVYFQLDKQGHFSNWFKWGTNESLKLKLLVNEIIEDSIPYKEQLRN